MSASAVNTLNDVNIGDIGVPSRVDNDSKSQAREATNILNYIVSKPWLATEAAVNTVLSIARRENDIHAVAARVGRSLDNTRLVTMRQGVAILEVNGTIFRYASLFHRISGGTSIEILSKELIRLLIVLKVKQSS